MLFSIVALAAANPPSFSLYDLQKDWSFSVAKQSALFGDASDFHVRGNIQSYVMKANNSIKFVVKSGYALGDPVWHINVTDDTAEVFDKALNPVALLKFGYADDVSAFVRGTALDGNFSISGVVGPMRQSVLTITATDSDLVFVVRATPPVEITGVQIVQKLIPSFCIVLFMGFGRIYRRRFWDQFSQMNTRTLQNRIQEAKQRESAAK